jgi:hypothetical protein
MTMPKTEMDCFAVAIFGHRGDPWLLQEAAH